MNNFKRGDLCTIVAKYSDIWVYCYCATPCKGARVGGTLMLEVMAVESRIVITQAIDNNSHCVYKFYFNDLLKIG